LIAKNEKVANEYCELIQKGKIQKLYFAKVKGKFKE
jgi:23S rRNA-/tRNA-specific pseudouridylate synthase